MDVSRFCVHFLYKDAIPLAKLLGKRLGLSTFVNIYHRTNTYAGSGSKRIVGGKSRSIATNTELSLLTDTPENSGDLQTENSTRQSTGSSWVFTKTQKKFQKL